MDEQGREKLSITFAKSILDVQKEKLRIGKQFHVFDKALDNLEPVLGEVLLIPSCIGRKLWLRIEDCRKAAETNARKNF